MQKNQINSNNDGDRRNRRRIRGMMESRTGKVVGITSIAAPVIGYIINDLRRPNSFVRQLLCKVVTRLLQSKNREVEAIDITDEVEILNENNHNKLINN